MPQGIPAQQVAGVDLATAGMKSGLKRSKASGATLLALAAQPHR